MGRGLRSVVTATLTASLGVFGAASVAQAAPTAVASSVSSAVLAANPYERGPAPTNAYIESTQGSYQVASKTISRSAATGFGGGTIYYPTSTADGRFGEVAVSPGFTSAQSVIQWLGPRLASFGFVVITIDTLSRYDQPAARGDQLLAALDQVAKDPTVGSRVDPARASVVGHSMGGGGTLEASKDRPALQAAVGLAPYDSDKSWPEVTAASLEIGAQNDTTAPPNSHAIPFYNSLTNAERRAYLELRGGNHSTPRTSSNVTVSKYTVSWLKRYVDDDTRYEQFLSPGPATSTAVSAYRIS